MTYKLRYFLSFLLFATCSLSFIAFGADGDNSTSTTILKPTPTLATTTQSSTTPTTQSANICDTLESTSNIIKTCKDFLKNENASGGNTFSKAVVVSNTKELAKAVTEKYVSGKIIVLQYGIYELSQALEITEGIALVGEVQNNTSSVSTSVPSSVTYPVIRAADDFSALGYDEKTSTFTEKHNKKALVYLHNFDESSTGGFFSHHIHWKTTYPSGKPGILFNGAINSQSYEGKIRLYQNEFSQANAGKNFYFINLINATGGAYINDNKFDTSHFNGTAIYAYCKKESCQTSNPPLEINSNHFFAQFKPVGFGTQGAIKIKGYAQFKILENTQETKYALGHIYVEDHKNIQSIDAYIQNNRAHPEAPERQRKIELLSSFTPEESAKITGKIHISGNANYEYHDGGYGLEHIDYTSYQGITLTPAASSSTPPATNFRAIEPSATQPAPATSSITPTKPPTAICDRDNIVSSLQVTSSEIDACKAFLKNKKASAGRSFDKAVVINSASDLIQVVSGDFLTAGADASKLIILKNGTYKIPHSLNITHKIALVGVVKDGSYPVIRAADHFSAKNHNTHSLAYLYDDPEAVAEKGFYSHHIHWDTTNPSAKAMLLLMGAINSQSYKGEFRLYENQFSESKHDYTISYLRLTNATGNTYINSNRFNTAYLKTAAIYANCLSSRCVATPPQLEISSNYFHSKAVPYRNSRPGMMVVRGYVRYKILDNQQETKDAAGSILVKDHSNKLHMDAYIKNNIAHSGAPEFERRIIVESFFSPDESIDVTGKLHVSGNDYYKFKESGLDLKYVDYTPGRSLASSQIASTTITTTTEATPAYVFPSLSPDSITPTQLQVSATASVTTTTKKHPCNDIKDDATAFATCDAFLKNEKASGPASSKPTFSHAFIVDSSKSLMDAVKQERFDGKRFIGSIIVLRPGTYELPQPLLINHRIALLGEKDKEGAFPTIKAANDFNVPTGSQHTLAYLYRPASPQDAGFFSVNLKWTISLPAATSSSGTYTFDAFISSLGYEGDIRISDNRFGHDDEKVDSLHILHLPNTGQRYYIGDNIFDTSRVIVNAVESDGPYSGSHDSRIEIKSNTFTTSLEPDFTDIKSIVLSRYQHLSVFDNVQETARAAGSIEINFNNNVDIKDATVRNNKAHKKAAKDQRTIWLKLNKELRDSPVVSGSVDVGGNDYYEFSYSDLPKANFHHEYGKRVGSDSSASVALSTTPLTPTPSHNVPASTQTVKSMSAPSVPANPSAYPKTPPLPSNLPWLKSTARTKTPTPLTSLCDRLSSAHEAQHCQSFQDRLKKMEVDTTFSEVVAVKSSEELISEAAGASESGKIILLHTGSYLLDEPLHMRNKVALVGVGNPVIKSAYTVYKTESRALILLNDDAASDGFYSKGITWDITAPGSSESQPYSSAIKAMNYQGDVVILDDDFQYQSTRESEEAPAHYIDIQKSTGNVRIADNIFFTGGLKEAAIYANCKECLKDNQYINIFGNHFTDTDTEDEKSTPIAIDIRYYKALHIHRNVQETESATAQINIVLPNYKDDINALIENNIALGSAATEKRTIFLTVDRLAKVPVSIGGSLRVLNNQCYTIRDNGIPSYILDIIRGGCSASASASAHAQSKTQTSGGMNNKDWAGPVIGGFALLYVGTGIFGCTNLPGHKGAHAFFIFPKTAVLFIASKIAELYRKIRVHNPNRAEVIFDTLKQSTENEPHTHDRSTESLINSEEDDHIETAL